MTAVLPFDPTAFVVAGAAFLGAFASGLAGFAFGLVAYGLWLHVLSPQIAGPLVIVASLISQCLSLMHVRRAFRFDLLWPFLIGGIIGTPIGVWLLAYIDPLVLRRATGIFLVAYASFFLLRPPVKAVHAGGRVADSGIGFVSGVMNGLAGLSGPLSTAWCSLRGWDKDVSRGVYQPFIMAVQVAALPALLGAGLLNRELGYDTLLCVPAMLLGVWLGVRLYVRINEVQFRKLILWLLLASGASLLV
jgi:uncharacterized membrane protein YfcA